MAASPPLHPRRGRRLVAAVVPGLLAVLLAVPTATAAPVLDGAAGAAGPPVPTLAWVDCGGGFQCATARVPLDYDYPRGPSISLALKRLPASDPAHRIGSLFLNSGGPGGSGVDLVTAIAPLLQAAGVAARLDLVGFDPRRIGQSSPIRCFASNDEEQRFLAGVPPFPVDHRQQVAFMAKLAEFGQLCQQRNATIMRHICRPPTWPVTWTCCARRSATSN